MEVGFGAVGWSGGLAIDFFSHDYQRYHVTFFSLWYIDVWNTTKCIFPAIACIQDHANAVSKLQRNQSGSLTPKFDLVYE